MKSFKVRDGKMLVDGVYYSESPSDNVIMGKMGKIHSINVMGKQMFPYGGTFNDGTIKVEVDTPIVKVSKKSKTELKESNGLATDESGKPIKKAKKSSKK